MSIYNLRHGDSFPIPDAEDSYFRSPYLRYLFIIQRVSGAQLLLALGLQGSEAKRLQRIEEIREVFAAAVAAGERKKGFEHSWCLQRLREVESLVRGNTAYLIDRCDLGQSPELALLYLADCIAATVADLAEKKRPPVGESQRHYSMGRSALAALARFGIDDPKVRGRLKAAADKLIAKGVALTGGP